MPQRFLCLQRVLPGRKRRTNREVWSSLPSIQVKGPVLRIRDVYPGSRIRLFSISDPGTELSPSRIPDPVSASKNLSILTPKKLFLSSKKYDLGCSSRIPDMDPQHWKGPVSRDFLFFMRQKCTKSNFWASHTYFYCST